jgi:hypothetical protein
MVIPVERGQLVGSGPGIDVDESTRTTEDNVQPSPCRQAFTVVVTAKVARNMAD